jgi:hypothetical protein
LGRALRLLQHHKCNIVGASGSLSTCRLYSGYMFLFCTTPVYRYYRATATYAACLTADYWASCLPSSPLTAMVLCVDDRLCRPFVAHPPPCATWKDEGGGCSAAAADILSRRVGDVFPVFPHTALRHACGGFSCLLRQTSNAFALNLSEEDASTISFSAFFSCLGFFCTLSVLLHLSLCLCTPHCCKDLATLSALFSVLVSRRCWWCGWVLRRTVSGSAVWFITFLRCAYCFRTLDLPCCSHTRAFLPWLRSSSLPYTLYTRSIHHTRHSARVLPRCCRAATPANRKRTFGRRLLLLLSTARFAAFSTFFRRVALLRAGGTADRRVAQTRFSPALP